MLSYVLSSGFSHIAHVDPRSTFILEALESLGLDVRHHPSHWDCLCALREEDLRWPYPPWPVSRHDFVLYILIAYSSVQLLQSFLGGLSGHRPLEPRTGTNPLVYAADLRKTEHAMALLACGANVNASSLVADGSHKALPLEIAIDLGEDVLVGELLQRGCVVTSEVLTTAICMPWCSTRVLAKLLQTDEFVEWANEIGDEKLYRGVFNGARPNAGDSQKADEDHVTLARRLRQIGQDLSADSPFGVELIERAVHAGHTSMLEYLLPADQPPPPRFLLASSTGDTSETLTVMRFLLRRGVDVNAVSDGRGDTALHLAAMCPWEPRSLELTQMLIDAGCGPHARNLRDETPWIIAAERGYSLVVELLISSNVPLPPDILLLALRKHSAPQIIQALIHKGADVHSTTPNGDTVLHLTIAIYVARTGWDLVKSFIKAGCNPAARNSKGNTVLGAAIKYGRTSVVELLLSCNVPLAPNILLFALRRRSASQIIQSLTRKGANVHSTTSDGNTVLHITTAMYVERTSWALVKSFIEAGCNPTARNSKGKTVLEAAIEREHLSVVELLLSCNVPLPSDILLFALRKRLTFQFIQFLIHKGADVNSTSFDEDAVLYLSIAQYVERTSLALVKRFMEAGCNPAAHNSKGNTIMEVAIERGYTSVVELLLSCNVPLPPDILVFALRKRLTFQIIQFLIRKGADVHSTSFDGDTVLHLAIATYVEKTSRDLVKTFMEAGCNLAARNSKGYTVLQVAFECGHTSVVELLLSYNVPFPSDILLLALQQRSTLQMIQSLIHKGADVHSTTSDGDTVLHLSIAEYVERTSWDLVKTFMEAGCNLAARNSKGNTVLQVAFECGHTSVVELLLLHNVPFPSDILLLALRQRSALQVIQSLIHKCADVHSTTPDGDTVLHLAIGTYVERMCWDLVKRFIEAGCNPSARNFKGKTVLESAIERGHTSVVELILSCNVPLPPDILPFALRQRSTSQMIHFLTRKNAYVHATTSDGDTVLHLAIAMYVERACWDLVKRFIEAGCNPTARNSKGKTVLEATIERGHPSVAELLLSCHVPLPPDILLFALRERSTPKMIRLLVRNGANRHATMFRSDRDALLQLVHASYAKEDCQQILEILNAAC